MSSTNNRQIITIGVTALVTFILSAVLFSVTDLNLLGTAGDPTTSGVLHDTEGNPLNRTLVQTYASDGSVYLDVTDRSGTFEIDKLANGNYVIVAASVDQQFGYIGEWIIDSDSEDYQFQVVPTGSLTGTVAGCDASCTVTLLYNEIALAVQNTQADGSFVLSGLAPATYSIVVYKANDSTEPQPVEITSTQITAIEIAF